MEVCEFWRAVLRKDRAALADYFCEDAEVRWHCSNEVFTAEEYVRANCDYPGEWDGELERVETAGETMILAGRVFPREGGASFHVVSFIRLLNGKIREMDEYWADDGEAPAWRREMGIGRPIRQERWI